MIYDFSVTRANGEEVSLREFEGKVMLIVNTATACGFTPQYTELQELHEKYGDKGLVIIDIPCNQFGEQAPGTDEEIKGFCTLKYNTQFEQMKKSEVKGENKLPLYDFLIKEKGFEGFGNGVKGLGMAAYLYNIDKNYKETPEIKWNFTKFLIDREGNVVERIEPTVSMKRVEEAVAKLI